MALQVFLPCRGEVVLCPCAAPFWLFCSLFLTWKLQQVLPNNDLFFSQHRITPKLIKIVKYMYFRQIDTLTRIGLQLNAGINQNLTFTVTAVIVSLYLWHGGFHCTYQVPCTSRMSQLLRGFIYISQNLIFEVPSRDVSKEKLDLNSI